MKKAVVLSVFLSVVTFAQAQVDHWETVVYDTLEWHYVVPDANTPSNWIDPAFDDAAWSVGNGGFGFGDGDDGTTVPAGTISVYHRIHFNINDWNEISKFILNMDYDDGYVAYLNGTEISRSNITSTGQPAWDQGADGQHEANMYQGGNPDQVIFLTENYLSILNNGDNVFCVEAHNISTNSGDLTSRPFLHIGLTTSNTYFGPTPSWFTPPFEFVSSTLPIVVVNTYGVEIPDEPKIDAEMGIIFNGDGQLNHVNDSLNEFFGLIAIEKRGSSSNSFPAKSYGLETRGPDSVNYNVSIFNWPADNDWILYAPYTDKAMIRNMLTYHLGNEMGRWTPRTKLCELILNGEYMGVYVFMERIKQNPGRVNINELLPADTLNNELTGGYILKVDKTTAGGIIAWDSPYPAQAPSNATIGIQLHDPELIELHPTQLNYIQNYFTDWEDALVSSDFTDPVLGYRKFIDVPSFIDFFLVNEVSKNVDGYRISSFFYKERFSEGNKLVAGPLWDFNIAWGNSNYCQGGETYGWEINFNEVCGGGNNPSWWNRLLEDSLYANEVHCRWNELRTTLLDTTYLYNYIDSLAQILEVPATRHYQRWPILGNYVWPNNFVGDTYQEEVDYLKLWIGERIAWMDANMFGTCDTTVHVSDLNNVPFNIYPNPTNDILYIETPFEKNFEIKVYTTQGTLVQRVQRTNASHTPLSLGNLPKGMYFIQIKNDDQTFSTQKIIVQ
ncbi:MAG: CotH kinase family protein [Flavobacteriales bacterium]|nr:CotH kinase family protein [Flavobacteriales bacterium]